MTGPASLASPAAAAESFLDHGCCVCGESEADADNPLVYCDRCNLGVHQQCYGYPLTVSIPADEWLCVSCVAQDQSQPVDASAECCLCPRGAACMSKRTTFGQWCHLSCALWIPEVFFRLPDGNDGVDTSRVPAHRFHRSCSYCGQSAGACMDCSADGCTRWFHIPCGIERGISLEYRAHSKPGEADLVLAFCDHHTNKWKSRAKRRRAQ